MSDYGDESDEDWAYLDAEDFYDDIDDLIEHTCPSPAYESSRNDSFEYDNYDYFNVDLEYLSDSYYDNGKHVTAGIKRKIGTVPRSLPPRRRYAAKGASQGPVLWRSQVVFHESPILSTLPRHESFSLLEDWRERFRDVKPVAMSVPDGSEQGLDTDAFDLHDLQSFAKLLVGDSLESLKAGLVAQGLKPEAIQVVLDDLLSGGNHDYDEHSDNDNPGVFPQNLEQESESQSGTHRFQNAQGEAPATLTGGQTRRQAQRPSSPAEASRAALSPGEVAIPGSKRKRDFAPGELARPKKWQAKSSRKEHASDGLAQTQRRRSTRK